MAYARVRGEHGNRIARGERLPKRIVQQPLDVRAVAIRLRQTDRLGGAHGAGLAVGAASGCTSVTVSRSV